LSLAMDLSNVPKLGELIGKGLSPDEMCGLEVGITTRRLEENISGPIDFWGKITGKTQDYLVVFSTDTSSDFPTRKYYYCNPPDFLLRALPDLSDEYKASAADITSQFTGDPSFYSFNGEEPEEEDPEAPPVERFRELHRLAWTVAKIDHDCALTPRGALVVDAGKRIVPNAYFTGLSFQSSTEPRSYYHMRKPENPQALAMMKKPGIIKSGDFLDGISKDTPSTMWTINTNASSTAAFVRNMYWGGYVFYCKIGSAEHGAAYFGMGTPEYDIAFMM